MMIFKYDLEPLDVQTIQMPKGAEILCAQVQRERIRIWAMCAKLSPTETRTFEVIGTGNPFDDARRDYIGSVQMMGGQLVWHIFERHEK